MPSDVLWGWVQHNSLRDHVTRMSTTLWNFVSMVRTLRLWSKHRVNWLQKYLMKMRWWLSGKHWRHNFRLLHVSANNDRTTLKQSCHTSCWQSLGKAAKKTRPFVSAANNNDCCQWMQQQLNSRKLQNQQKINKKTTAHQKERQPSESHGKADRTTNQGAVFSARAQSERNQRSAQSASSKLWESQSKKWWRWMNCVHCQHQNKQGKFLEMKI